MSDKSSLDCVLLPCGQNEAWAVPQRCLAEIVTIQDADEWPPDDINWRGEVIPVIDFGTDDELPWRDPRGNSGLIAVMLGLKGASCRYWGIAVRGMGLGVTAIEGEQLEDLPEAVLEHATAAFRMNGVVYQVPDLPALQQQAIDQGSTIAS